MHYTLEIIMPPTEDVEASLKEVMAQFDECPEDDEDGNAKYGFYDYYLIGGRWAGRKVKAMYDEERMSAFTKRLNDENITVSGIQFGKQEISPASQIPIVDSLWNEYFPDSPIKVCPLFKHSNSKEEVLHGDICKIGDIPERLTASRVIIAAPNYDGSALEAKYMIEDAYYNGVQFRDTGWDGNVLGCLEAYKDMIKGYQEDYRKKHELNADWICVTVDYHS